MSRGWATSTHSTKNLPSCACDTTGNETSNARHAVDLGIAVAVPVQARAAAIEQVEHPIGIDPAAGRQVEADRVVLAADLGKVGGGLDRLELAVDINLLQLVDQDDAGIAIDRQVARRHLDLEPLAWPVAQLLHQRAALLAVLLHVAAIARELPQELVWHVVHRSDGSGSSFTWADYLSKVSGEWKTRVGAKMMVDWPTGVGFRHSSGVAESVASIRGAIGYLDYGNAVRKNLAYALVRNRAGNFIAPGLANFQTASREVDWGRDRNFFITLTDAQAADAYPIMALSLAVIRSFSKVPGRAREMRAFFQWTMETGQDMASSLQYVPLPPSLIQQIEGFWRTEKQP